MAALPNQENNAWKALTSVSGESYIHQVDPRLRIAAAALFALIVVAGRDFVMLSTGLGIAALVAVLAQLSWFTTLKRMLAMDFFIVAMLIMLPLTLPGEALFQFGPLTASREGVLRAVEIALKANSVILALLALVGTIEVVTLGHALHHLRMPEKLVHLFLFTVRYIEVLNREYRRLRRAMQARAFVARSNWHTWRSIGYLLGMLLVRSLERSERIMAAMKCRGFRGQYYVLDHFAMDRRDWLFAASFGGCLLGLVGLELM
jgi:cobalt/nickel transport system permease protein